MSNLMANEIKLISGNSHPELSALVASRYAVHTNHPGCRIICTGRSPLALHSRGRCADAGLSPSRQARYQPSSDNVTQVLEPGDLSDDWRVGAG